MALARSRKGHPAGRCLGEHRESPRTAPRPGDSERARRRRRRRAADARLPVPGLRWPHDHHRDLRARLDAAHPFDKPDQDRLIMMPLTKAPWLKAPRPCRRSSTGQGDARPKAASAPASARHSDRLKVAAPARQTLPSPGSVLAPSYCRRRLCRCVPEVSGQP
jgi:hypothetical protein